MTPPPNHLLDAALSYAALGWRVHPLHHPIFEGDVVRCSCGKPDCAKQGKHPLLSAWTEAATTDPNKIRQWWIENPEANIGIAAGPGSGLFLIDIDGPGAKDRIEAYVKKHGITTAKEDLETTEAKTANGKHLVFAWTDGIGLENFKNSVRLTTDLDVRTDGGQFVVAPSVHPSGVTYEWVRSPWDCPPKPMPGWLADFLREEKALTEAIRQAEKEARRKEKLEKITKNAAKKKVARLKEDGTTPYGRAALEEEIGEIRASREGGRNDQLNRSAFSLFGLVKAGALNRIDVERELIRAAKSTGLKDDEVKRTLESAWSGAAAREIPDQPGAEEPPVEVPEDVKARAREVLDGGDPVAYVIDQFHRFHVGDDKLARVMLASVLSGSILNSAGIQPKLSGRSGAGKTHACKSLAHCLPPEIVVEASVSAKALYYLSDLRPGQVVFSDDIVMSEDLEGTLKRSMTNFQEGATHITLDRNRQPQRLPLPPRLTWWLTSVNDHFSDELINRQYGLNVKEDKDTDRQVFSHSMTRAAQGGEEFFVDEGVQVAREIIRQIRQNVYLVAVPFAERIGMADVSDRRNPGRFLDLIRAAAVARVMQRKAQFNGDGVVIVDASEDDFVFAEELFADRASNLIRKVNNSEDDLLAFIAVRGSVSGAEIVRDFRLRDGRGVSIGYLHDLLHGRKDRGGKGLLDRIEGLSCKKESVQTDEGKTVFQNVYTLHTAYNRWDSFDKAVWLETEDLIRHGFVTDSSNAKNGKTTPDEQISITLTSDSSDSSKPGGAKSEGMESRVSEGKGEDLTNLTKTTKATPLDSDLRLRQPDESDGENGRLLGLSLAYYRDLGGGQLPTVRALMDDQKWPVEKAQMAIGMLEKMGYSRGFNCPD